MSELPLLEGCAPADLPQEIQAWIEPGQALPPAVSYYRSYVPLPALLHGATAVGLGGFGVLMLGSMAMRLVAGNLTAGHAGVFLVASPLFFLAALAMLFRARRAHRIRRDHRQGRIRTGYFASKAAFLDFDGSRAWLVPHRFVQKVRIRRNPGRGGAEHALLYRRGEETVSRRLEGTVLLPQGLNAWHKRQSLPSGHGWEWGAPRFSSRLSLDSE